MLNEQHELGAVSALEDHTPRRPVAQTLPPVAQKGEQVRGADHAVAADICGAVPAIITPAPRAVSHEAHAERRTGNDLVGVSDERPEGLPGNIEQTRSHQAHGRSTGKI